MRILPINNTIIQHVVDLVIDGIALFGHLMALVMIGLESLHGVRLRQVVAVGGALDLLQVVRQSDILVVHVFDVLLQNLQLGDLCLQLCDLRPRDLLLQYLLSVLKLIRLLPPAEVVHIEIFSELWVIRR